MSWSLVDRSVLITGGNAGIGRATAIELARRGADVLITARDPEKGAEAQRAIAEASGRSVELVMLDLSRFDSIREAAEDVLARRPTLGVLINNAGVVLGRRQLTAEGFEMTFGVNHVGPYLLTDLLAERLRDTAKRHGEARIINVASDAHFRAKSGLTWDDLDRERRYVGFEVYCETKLANVLYTRALAEQLDGTGVSVNALHPGVVATRFSKDGDFPGPVSVFFTLARPLLKSPEKGAATSVHLAAAPELSGVSGRYYSNLQPREPSRWAKDPAAAERLWKLTGERIVAALKR
ncbi:MAG: SDR family oxidoreductase [Myxococcota bacterium]